MEEIEVNKLLEHWQKDVFEALNSDRYLRVFNYSKIPVTIRITFNAPGFPYQDVGPVDPGPSRGFKLNYPDILSLHLFLDSRLRFTGRIFEAIPPYYPSYFIHSRSPEAPDSISVVAMETSSE